MVRKTIIIVGVFILSSCSKFPYKNTFVVSDTYLTVVSYDKRAARIVYDEFRRLDKIFNLYDSNSELARLNRTFNTPFRVSKELIEVLLLSQQVYQLTDGSFDVSRGKLYSFWKGLIEKKNIKRLLSSAEVDKIKELGGMSFIEINTEDSTVTIKKKGLMIDLSGIAKGYMVDKAARRLKKEGISSALINAGGDIYCLRKDKDSYWKVGIRDPESKEGIVDTVLLSDEAIATSGNYQQFFFYKGKRYSHIINPKTGFPVSNNILSTTVVTKNCTTADSLATAFFVMGVKGIKEFLERVPSTMKIFVITETKEGRKMYVFK